MVAFSRVILMDRIKVLLSRVQERTKDELRVEVKACFYADENNPEEGKHHEARRGERWEPHP